MAITRPNDLLMGAGGAGSLQGAPPQGGPPAGARPPQGGPQGARPGGGMNPGGMQAVKAGIQQLLKMGLDEEQIVEAILKLAAESGMDIPEEEIRALIEQAAGAGGGAPQGAPPQAGLPGPQAPPTGGPPVNLPAGL